MWMLLASHVLMWMLLASEVSVFTWVLQHFTTLEAKRVDKV